MNYYAGMDIGGTNGRLKLKDGDGNILGEFTGPGCSINTDGYDKSRSRCRELVLPALKELELNPSDCMGICVAASGIDSPGYEKMCRDIFEEMGFKSDCIRAVNDCEVFLYLKEGPSMVVVSGTGSICYGIDAKGTIYRTGGWNHILSDEGSAFYLGMQTMRLAAEDLDERTKCPYLTRMFMEKSGLDTLEKIDLFVNEHLFDKSEIARFSMIAYDAAKQGDLQAEGILKDCAEKIWKVIEDTAREAGWIEQSQVSLASGKEKPHLWLWGSVLVKNEIIRDEVVKRVRQVMPEIDVAVPETSALDLALMLAGKIR